MEGRQASLPAARLHLGSATDDAGDRIVYNPATGLVSYDADGSGPTAALPTALLGNKPALTA